MPRKILFLCHRVPYPPDKGDRIRSYHILRLLESMGEVTLGYLADRPVPNETRDWLDAHCEEVICEPVGRLSRWVKASAAMLRGKSATEGLFSSAPFRRRIDELLKTRQFDAIVCFSSSVVQYVLGRGLESRTIVDLVDVDSQKWLDYAQRAPFPASWLFRWEAGRVRKIETNVAETRAVVMCTEPEAALYRSFCPSGNSTVIANGVDLEFFSPADEQPSADCVFIGYLDYRANVTGLQWFGEDVWPRLRARKPDASFRIVGRNPVPAVERLGRIPGVEVVGPVPDVRPFLHSSRVVIAPLQVARGVQNKVLEAMAAGRPVVATPQALTGIDVTDGVHVLSASTPAEWVDALMSVFENPLQARELGACARVYVESHHHWDSCLKPFSELMEDSSEPYPGQEVPQTC